LGRARQRQRLLDRATEVLAGQRQQPIVVDGPSGTDQRLVLVTVDVQDVWRYPELLGPAQEAHDLVLGLGRALGGAGDVLRHLLLGLAAGAARDPGLDDEVRSARRDYRQDLVGETGDRGSNTGRLHGLVQLAE